MLRKQKTVQTSCPICHGMHETLKRYWVQPSKPDVCVEGQQYNWDGFQTELWCDVETCGVVKMYTMDYVYIGYYVQREIPF